MGADLNYILEQEQLERQSDALRRQNRVRAIVIGQNSLIDWLYSLCGTRMNYRYWLEGLSEEEVAGVRVESIHADHTRRGIYVVLSHPDWKELPPGCEIPIWLDGFHVRCEKIEEPSNA